MPDNQELPPQPNYMHIAQRALGQPLLMESRYAQVFFSALGPRLGVDELRTLEGEVLCGEKMRVRADRFSADRPRNRSYRVVDGIAVLPVSGTLVNKFGYMRPVSGMTGYDGIIARVSEAQDDPDVEGILLDIDSGGGEVAGFFDAVEALAALRQQGKPLATLCYDMSCSAAQGIASVGSTRFITRNGVAGSVGVITAHRSYKDALEQSGMKVTLIYSGEHKADGHPYDDLPEEVLADIQTELNTIRGEFATVVAANTGMTLDAVLGTEARTYRGQAAIDIGLATHMINGFAAVAEFKQIIKEQRQSTVVMKGAAMSEEEKKDGGSGATAQDERARISAIVSSPEADGRRELANHLAFKTDLSADAAIAALGAAAKDVSQESDKSEDDAGNDLNAASETALDKMMAGEPDPDLSNDGDGKVSSVDAMLGAWSAATGGKVE